LQTKVKSRREVAGGWALASLLDCRPLQLAATLKRQQLPAVPLLYHFTSSSKQAQQRSQLKK